MARGILFPAGLITVLTVAVLVHQICSAEDCPPPSCGNIRNISFPFRLKGDPPNCGDQRYTLSCENNQTVLYLYAGKYYVRQINYNNYTIRVVDSGIQKGIDSFIPRYSLGPTNFSSGDPYQVEYFSQSEQVSVVFLKCERPVKSPWYFDISCLKNGVYSSNSSLSNSKKYAYFLLSSCILAGSLSYSCTGDVEDLCQVAQVSVSLYMRPYYDNISCTAVRNKLLLGFELSWLQFYCQRLCGGNDYCYLDEKNNVTCLGNGPPRFYMTLLWKCAKVLVAVIKLLVPRKIRQKYGIPYIHYGNLDNYTGILETGLPSDMLYLFGPPIALKMILGALCVPCVIAFLIYKWRRRHLSMYDDVEEFLQNHNNLMPIRYSYSEVKKMTKSFKDKLGEGAFGTVFKGTLQSGRLVAIKMLGNSKANGQDFISEVATIGMIHHVNVVQLIGYCVEGSKRALVYEFMPNGSLNTFIFSPEVSIILSHDKMYDIALGVARGIEYLHQGCDMQILHFDIKPHNILLDENFTPKVSDFGLAKLYPIDESIVSLTAARGTLGYMAPELFYKNIGGVSYKADVYSFGMLLMEIASRRKNLNAFTDHLSQIYFPTWVYEQLHDGKDIEMKDVTEEEKKIGMKMIIVALWCIQMKPSDRPSMNKVVQMLEGEVEYLQMPSRPFLSSSERITEGTVGESLNQSSESSQS